MADLNTPFNELTPLQQEKIQLIRETGETKFWEVFMEHPDDVPSTAVEYAQLEAIIGRQAKQLSREKAQAGLNVVDRMRSKCTAIRGFTDDNLSLQRMDWTSTP